MALATLVYVPPVTDEKEKGMENKKINIDLSNSENRAVHLSPTR